jgi:ribosomal protein S18 acetylase RimI-like enzyme
MIPDVFESTEPEHAMDHRLDNPVWHALVGPHAGIAIGAGLARHYPRDTAPFSAVADPSATAYQDLARGLPEGLEARLFRPAEEPAPKGWESVSARPILQMVLGRAAAPDRGAPADQHIQPLAENDTEAMLALAEAAKPGPFDRRTATLGTFVGIVLGKRLLAMAGERFRLPGYVELSAIAVDPTARGRGLASTLIIDLCRRAAERDEIPFLHVFPDNPAVRLYERLGFRTRRRLWVLWHRPAPR